MSSFEKLYLPKGHSSKGKVGWRSPSNIALVKYWGKKPVQLPTNASISFTLSEAHSETIVSYQPREENKHWVDFFFEGGREPSFAQRIEKYLYSILSELPFLDQLSFTIESTNSFPHSSGIASSASSMSALALCLCDIQKALFEEVTEISFNQVSHLSRLASGSASRSVFPQLAVWGKHDSVPNSSDFYAIPYRDIHDTYKGFHDDVLIVSADKKSVSSSAGHQLMNGNPFAPARYEQARKNLSGLLQVMKTDDLMAFGKIIEDEALTLHALMMCSDPSYILMLPNTLEVINRIRSYRTATNAPIFFTLDAGPNVHILYPDSIAVEAKAFIQSSLMELAHEGRVIEDIVGQGPQKLIL